MLNNPCVEKEILTLLYQSTVESNICSSATVWNGPKLSRNGKNKLIKVVKKAKTFGVEAKSLDVFYQEDGEDNEQCKPSSASLLCVPQAGTCSTH